MDYSKLVVVVSVLVPFFAQSFKEDLVKADQLFSPGAAHCLSALSGAQRECSHGKGTLKVKCSLGDEDCIVKRKRCYRKSASNELLGSAFLPENNVGNTHHFSSIITLNPTASRIKET